MNRAYKKAKERRSHLRRSFALVWKSGFQRKDSNAACGQEGSKAVGTNSYVCQRLRLDLMGIIERIVGSRAGTITAKHLTGDGSKLAQAIPVNFNRHKGTLYRCFLREPDAVMPA